MVAVIALPDSVPGTDFLAIVAAENPRSDRHTMLRRDRAPQFYGVIGDAASAVDDSRSDDGGGRAGVDAERAGTALIERGLVRRQFQCRHHEPDEKIGAHLL